MLCARKHNMVLPADFPLIHLCENRAKPLVLYNGRTVLPVCLISDN